jgi:uncharacterized protein (TIGR02300 family)
MTAAKDLGRKHLCWKCGTKFYDLKKPAPVCPKCGSDPRESPALRAPQQKKEVRPAPRAEPAEEVDLAEEADLEKDLEEAIEEEAEEPEDES